MRPAREQLQRLGQRRRALLIQSAMMAASAAVLVLGAGSLDGSPIDLQFLFLSATGLFSLATIHWVDEVCTILESECPCCAGHFFGTPPETVPSPLRRHCSHCGAGLAPPPPDPAERGATRR